MMRTEEKTSWRFIDGNSVVSNKIGTIDYSRLK